MSKSGRIGKVEGRSEKLGQELGFEIVDVCITKDDTGETLGIYIDKPEGISLDDCEKFHRAIQPQLEDIDYDFLEVSSPGADRPLKKDKDFQRALGQEVEIHFFKPINGCKIINGILSDWSKETFTIENADGAPAEYQRKSAALIKPVIDMEGIEEIEFTDEEGEKAE